MTEPDEADTIEPVALLRIPGWEPPDELDVRELDDGALVYLAGGSFDADPEELWAELLGVVGDALLRHEDERGVFFLPDAADPDDVATYEGVVAAVGDQGAWIQPSRFGAGAEELFAALASGDPDAMKLARVQAQSALENAMRQLGDILGTMGLAGPEERAPSDDDTGEPSGGDEPKR
jgi:hypothetical protein